MLRLVERRRAAPAGPAPRPSPAPLRPRPLCPPHLKARSAAASVPLEPASPRRERAGRGVSASPSLALFRSHLFMNSISLSFLKTTEL